MKTIFEHIEHVKGKPHHVRKRVAFAAAAAVTGIVALVWLIGSVSLGVFAIPSNSFADSAGPAPVIVDNNDESIGLAGAAAALPSASTPAHIEIIDATPSTPKARQVEQTTLPF